MNSIPKETTVFWPLLLYLVLVIVLVCGMIGLSYVLGERHREKETGEPYESGILATGSARLRFSANFYLVAMLFVIFDLEAVFIFAWAVSFRALGWAGYLGMAVFTGILLVILAYEWRNGALDFVRKTTKSLPVSREDETRQERT
jgi:NADH-quinone oxidoreductase subunit A